MASDVETWDVLDASSREVRLRRFSLAHEQGHAEAVTKRGGVFQ